MRENWKYLPLGEIVEIKRGLTYSKNDEVDISGKIVLRSNNVNLDNHQFDFTELKYLKPTFDIPADKYLQKGDLLMCMSNGSKAHLGKVALYDGESDKYAFGGFMAALSHKDSVIGRYLFYAMITPMYKEYIKTLSDGANINNLKVRDIEAFSIPVPPLSEQERIVALLDDQFAKIDALKANAASQLQAAKDLFQSALKEVFEANRNWKYKSFEDCLQKVPKQKAVKSKDYLENGMFPIVSQESDLISGYTDDENILYKHENPVIIFGDHTKNIKYIDFNFVVGADGVHILSVKDDILPKFFYYELCSIKLRNLGYARHYKLLKEKEIGYPKLTEQERIAARLDAISEKVKALQANYDQTITLCNDLKQALLKSIFE